MTFRRWARSIALALVSVSLLFAGCSRPGAGPATSYAASATATPEPSASARPSIEPPTEPPAASVAVEGGDPVIGQLGSFTWDNSGSDGPWLPGNPIRIGSGEQLTLTLADPVGVMNWTVSRAPAGANGSGVVGMAQGSGGPVTFGAPPPGSWSVSVDVWFADNRGSAAYYWLIEVD
jgi:hypothetical protein